ncbi:MAG: hypothetical protein N5P05_004457 (plasmid) [Chroococcopsis gigantea SAG 12.99]|jgi:transcriptional regulator with XRE-family HTH domain|nr:helix-turn-helix transcriptional regulator [Chlorogloea purpurea SAG 13.99]MDV3002802.1 hypothetical protein [Chroococcopsis gigantea SAG 12.99]
MFREVVKKVKEARKITTKALSDQTRISPNHISKFLSGDRDVTTETLSRLVEGMEMLSPGAEKDFFTALTGVTTRPTFRQVVSNMEPGELLEALEGEIFADLIHAFADTLKESRQPARQAVKSASPQKTKRESTSTKSYQELLIS